MTDTKLDIAHTAMQADLEDDAARLRFYERLADGELFLLLTEEAKGDDISPEMFELEADSFVLVFDREERLAEFVGAPAPYAALPGRVIAGMLAGQNVGLGVNLGVAPSSILIPAEAMDWLANTLGRGPEEVEARISELSAPTGLPEALITGLDAKLASAGGLAACACLSGVTFSDGRRGHLLGFVNPVPGAEAALAGAANEALTFSGIEAGQMDVGFFAEDDPVTATLLRVGLRFDLPVPESNDAQEITPGSAPGMNPDRPPILK
ncbi:SseB family protein [Aliiroseovarius subalbicans]|uniref:SseB family protein n=1 Tax=Aliiroseovarius subalbicans TaxID=2925840 RepID=UPI001F56CCA8|nr:SseB family protein [Aliiroseovarius subalbicans]MCI2400800.1 SseB family protein [Aliiroseovarius subalbicans]